MDGKVFWKSRTFWAGFLSTVAMAIPPVAAFQAANPMVYDAFKSFLFGVVLRSATNQPIIWAFSSPKA